MNAISFHPVHGTLATVGSDGRFSFWDKDARTKLKTSEQLDQPITACCFNHNGNIFAYASSYDWSKGHEYYNPQKKNYIFLRNAAEELKPRNKKWWELDILYRGDCVFHQARAGAGVLPNLLWLSVLWNVLLWYIMILKLLLAYKDKFQRNA